LSAGLTPWTTHLRSWLRLALASLLAATNWATAAQTIESVLRPGEVIRGHARWEEDCATCHVRFDRAAQDRLCMECHKDVGQDMRERTGFHGRQRPQVCRSCHTDHKGRNARIVEFDAQRFDHAQSDYALGGRHAVVACANCHEPGKKYRQAPSQCNACHRKDNVHKGSLGTRCADCHTDNDWKQARFDHDTTRFALRDRHASAACGACHAKGTDHKDAPRTCVGCHKKDDDGARGHKGRFGERCDSCHGAKAWKPSTFNHDIHTRYALRGRHRTVQCSDCHAGSLFRDKLGSACIDCHQKDDNGTKGHKGSLGRDCAACHAQSGWKDKARFDHDRTPFPLLGRHAATPCGDCHKSTHYKQAPKDCIGCHRKDDRHEATLGTPCGNCHVERDWKTTTRFDHDRTRFRLRSAHAAKTVPCMACHADLKRYRDTPIECVACHRKDDRHEGQQGTKCESCHDDRDWKTTPFDHRLSRFALVGRHLGVKCAECHRTPRFKDAPRECFSCHRKDDKHHLKFGTACESCHNARAWGIWDYDHTRRANFELDGAHARLPCVACHARPAPSGKAAAEVGTTCVACHRRDDTHDDAFGPVCGQCHATTRWNQIRQRTGSMVHPGVTEGKKRP
jgi:hypothetical protein